jgi:opacity protein-like surface antigen
MKKIFLAASLSLAAMSASAQAADLDREIGLIVSGVVDQWIGGQYIDAGVNDDTVFATGGQGLFSLPLGENLSIQNDFKYETNERAFDEAGLPGIPAGPRYSYQYAAHMSWRDPMSGLFGAFGGMGTTNQNRRTGFDNDYWFVGGEGQFYTGNMTFYVQGGYVDFDEQLSPIGPIPAGVARLDDGLFARGVFRWFLHNGSRLQVEGTYLNADFGTNLFGNSPGEMEAFSVGARYDFSLGGMPILGEVPLYVAYRGTFRDVCGFDPNANQTGLDDHTFMIGTSYSFSGDRLTVDRQGATLDTPDFNYNCFGFQRRGAQGSDRRLKTDIAELGTDANGNKLYSWKYNSDPVTTWVGVMAQDLVNSHPEALVVDSRGYYAVRYDLIGAQMMTLEQWNSRKL